MDLAGTSVLVTGGASGLGEMTARELAEQGAKITVLDMNLEQAQNVAGEMGGLAVQADVTSEDAVKQALDTIEEIHGAPRVVVHCAGVGTAKRVLGREGPMAQDDFERVVSINLFGTFNIMRLSAERMLKLEPLQDGERGVCINTASVAAFDGQIGQAAYAASKGGIVSMTLPIAREFAQHGIRVNVIAPGIFLTPLLYTLPEEAQKALAADIPFPSRLGDPAEFADTVLYMIRNRYLNAEVIRLDGGVRLKPR